MALRALLCAFIVTAAVFSALPLLRYLRGHTIFDYELWYATGKRVLAGDEIFFFRAGKYDFMYPPKLLFIDCRLSFCILNNKQQTRDQLASCLAKRQ